MILPRNGVLYLDANALIYLIEDIAPYADVLRPFWVDVQAGNASIVTSTLSMLETTVRPLRDGDTILTNAYESLLTNTAGVGVIALSVPVLQRASRLRAAYPKLRTPDALHAASALLSGADGFVTNDDAFTRVPELPTILLHNLAP